MSEEKERSDDALWRRLVETHLAFAMVGGEFLADGVDRVRLMRKALRGGDRATAFYIAPYLRQAELMELFEELVELSSFSHGSVTAVHELIKSLPREFVLANVERLAEPLLRAGDYDEYRCLLALYSGLDAGLARRLAERAAQSPDEDIREAGLDYLSEGDAGR